MVAIVAPRGTAVPRPEVNPFNPNNWIARLVRGHGSTGALPQALASRDPPGSETAAERASQLWQLWADPGKYLAPPKPYVEIALPVSGARLKKIQQEAKRAKKEAQNAKKNAQRRSLNLKSKQDGDGHAHKATKVKNKKAKAGSHAKGVSGESDEPKRKSLPKLPEKAYRLLLSADLNPSISEKQVELLWPDDGTWYGVEVVRYDPESHLAAVVYQTGETEDVQLSDVVRDKEGRVLCSTPLDAETQALVDEHASYFKQLRVKTLLAKGPPDLTWTLDALAYHLLQVSGEDYTRRKVPKERVLNLILAAKGGKLAVKSSDQMKRPSMSDKTTLSQKKAPGKQAGESLKKKKKKDKKDKAGASKPEVRQGGAKAKKRATDEQDVDAEKGKLKDGVAVVPKRSVGQSPRKVPEVDEALVARTDIEDPEAIQGLRVCAYWSYGKCWFDGIVVGSHPRRGTLRVLYNDGTHEEVSMKRRRLYWADGEHPPSRPRPVRFTKAGKGSTHSETGEASARMADKPQGLAPDQPTRSSREKVLPSEPSTSFKTMSGSDDAGPRRSAPTLADLAGELGQDVVGTGVRVRWNEDGKWYSGIVSNFNARRQECEVLYDDNSRETMSVRSPDVELLTDDGKPKKRKRQAGLAASTCAEEEPAPKATKRSQQFSAIVDELGQNALGTRLQIKWQYDNKWYAGVVSKINERRKEFEFVYDDGSVEVLAIDMPHIKLLTDA
mmetsp:Transcript_7167/g.26347  ORF Transcript_7167/g.26347 Transcript_7167/m.26347 type:complete len:725 (+) Transcript_7167:272-2446(+)